MTFHVEHHGAGDPWPRRDRPPLADIARDVAKLRGYRVRSEPDQRVGAPLTPLLKRVRKAMRAADAAEAGLVDVVPETLRGGIRRMILRRGTAVLVVPSPARRKRLQDWLIAGGEARLRSASGGAVTKVIIRHAAPSGQA